MKTTIVASGLVLGLATVAGAGEIVLKNGSHVTGELASETLLLSTKAGALEVASGQVRSLTSTEVRLKDGRVIQGTIVGDTIRARTPLGELAIKVDEFTSFKADADAAATAGAPGAAPPAASPQTAAAPAVGKAPTPSSSTASLTPLGTAVGPAAGPGPGPAEPGPAVATSAAGQPEPTPPASGPGQVVSGAKALGHGVETTAKGIGQTVVEGADATQDGIKGFALKVWDVMRGVGHAFQNAFGS